mmetsp:Transcript_32880/g.97668  ORF Transcript_32880/g.97668 Transcript_32880/m.97668 type:complete len:298 (+) Transcript_32880:34-927(+)
MAVHRDRRRPWSQRRQDWVVPSHGLEQRGDPLGNLQEVRCGLEGDEALDPLLHLIDHDLVHPELRHERGALLKQAQGCLKHRAQQRVRGVLGVCLELLQERVQLPRDEVALQEREVLPHGLARDHGLLHELRDHHLQLLHSDLLLLLVLLLVFLGRLRRRSGRLLATGRGSVRGHRCLRDVHAGCSSLDLLLLELRQVEAVVECLVVEVLGVMCPCIYVHLEAVPHHGKVAHLDGVVIEGAKQLLQLVDVPPVSLLDGLQLLLPRLLVGGQRLLLVQRLDLRVELVRLVVQALDHGC